MTQSGRRLILLMLAAPLGCASGCFGLSQNPSYFPHFVPFGDVVQTHPKPIGLSYYSNFDPHAVDLAVEPSIVTSQVGSQVVILATVRDEKGNPRRHRRIDWIVTNGNLIEVDESGILNGRGGVEGNRGWSFTNHSEHRLSRGNVNKADDIMVRPGQSWCVVSSPVEADTHVQVVVPGIFNWEKRIKTAIVRWVDAVWEFPPRASSKFGVEHEFVTKIARHTDRLPLANYRVRYKIMDGPPAMFLPSRAQEHTSTSDLSGLAKVRIAQLAPASGINRVSVEIIRPPDPTSPSGTGVPIITGETSIEWLAPDVRLSHSGPPTAVLGTDVLFTTSATNNGRVDSHSLEFALPIPDGLEFVRSQPAAKPENGQLFFPFGTLGVGQTHTVQTTFKCSRPGAIKSVAIMKTAEGQNDQKEANLLVTTPQLKVSISGQKTGLVDVPLHFSIRLSNPGTGDLDQIQLMAEYDKGLEHEKQTGNFLETKVLGLKAGESRDETLILTPRRAGALGIRVTASSAGLKQQDSLIVTVQQPKVSMRLDGPIKSFVGRPAEYKLLVKNDSDAELTGVVARTRLPAETRFTFANRNGVHVAGEVTWNLGTMKAGEEISLELTAECQKAVAAADVVALVIADGNIRAEKASRLEIQGIGALQVDLTDLNDPVEVGKSAFYRLTITNTGSSPVSRIDVKATVPDELKALQATGPTQQTIVGRSVAFDKVDNLQPGAKITFMFECQALKAGDVRFRVEYVSELNQTPIVREESTKLVAPFAAPVGPIPNPNPPTVSPAPPIPNPPPPPGGGTPMPLPKGP